MLTTQQHRFSPIRSKNETRRSFCMLMLFYGNNIIKLNILFIINRMIEETLLKSVRLLYLHVYAFIVRLLITIILPGMENSYI